MKIEVSGTVTHRWTATLDVPDEVGQRWIDMFDSGEGLRELDSEIFENWIDPREHYDEGTDAELDDLNEAD